MEVSTINNVSGIELTEEAKDMIVQLVELDHSHTQDKVFFYERLYELWKNDLATTTKTKKYFEDNRKFIKETIFNCLSTELQEKISKAKTIYHTINNGNAYQDSDTTIDCNPAEISKYQALCVSYNGMINRRFTKLLNEFIEFVNNRKYQVPDSILFAPLEPARPTRECLARHAKDKALLMDYSGMSSEPEG